MSRAQTVLAVEFTPLSWGLENFREVAAALAKSVPKRGPADSLSASSSPGTAFSSKKSPNKKQSSGSSSTGGGSRGSSSSSNQAPRSATSGGRPAPSGPQQGSQPVIPKGGRLCIGHIQSILTPSKGIVCTNTPCDFDHNIDDVATLSASAAAKVALRSRIESTFQSKGLKANLFEALSKL